MKDPKFKKCAHFVGNIVHNTFRNAYLNEETKFLWQTILFTEGFFLQMSSEIIWKEVHDKCPHNINKKYFAKIILNIITF